MSFLRSELAQWRAHPLCELLAGAVATFALVPEVIAFSFVAGVDPQVGLFASFVLSVVIAVSGGRPAMITAAAGSVALVAAPLVASHGVAYLFAAGVLAGVVQLLFGALRLGVLMRFVLEGARLWDITAMAALNKVVTRFRRHGIRARARHGSAQPHAGAPGAARRRMGGLRRGRR